MNSNTFVFNLEWYAVLTEYPAEVRFEVYEAIMRYAASGTLSDLKPLAKMAFSFIRKEMDFNRKRYEETVEKRREAGRKGGAAKQSKQMPAMLSINENVNVNDNDNDNETGNDNGPRPAAADAEIVVAVDDDFVERVFTDKGAIEAFCSNNKVAPEEFRRIAAEIVNEWKLTGQRHSGETDARRHLLNQARIKINRKNSNPKHTTTYETQPNDRYAKRRGADSAARRAEDYTGEI